MHAWRFSWEAAHMVWHGAWNPKAEKMCSGQALKLWDVWVYLKQCDWAFFVLADWSGVAALQNFWRTHFITLPLISFYCSQFFLILLSVLCALTTLSIHFFLFISTVDGVVTSHMALPSGTASLTHITFKFQLYPWPLCDNLPSNKTITSYAQRLSFFSVQSSSSRRVALAYPLIHNIYCDLYLVHMKDLF